MKGQVSMEFMVIFASFLFILSVALVVTWTKTEQVEATRFKLEAEKITTLISAAINTAYLEGDGYAQNLTLPDNIIDLPYQILINSNMVIINHSLGTVSEKLFTGNITGNLTTGLNIIRNRNGTILINA